MCAVVVFVFLEPKHYENDSFNEPTTPSDYIDDNVSKKASKEKKGSRPAGFCCPKTRIE